MSRKFLATLILVCCVAPMGSCSFVDTFDPETAFHGYTLLKLGPLGILSFLVVFAYPIAREIWLYSVNQSAIDAGACILSFGVLASWFYWFWPIYIPNILTAAFVGLWLYYTKVRVGANPEEALKYG